MFYKIMWGFNDEHSISISSEELPKAIYCHLKGVPGNFECGSISGDKIITIVPDYHKIMGWNTGYKLDEYDYADLDKHGIRKKCQLELENAKEKVQFKLQTGRDLPSGLKSGTSSEIQKKIADVAKNKRIN